MVGKGSFLRSDIDGVGEGGLIGFEVIQVGSVGLQLLEQLLRAGAALDEGTFIVGETVEVGGLTLQTVEPGGEDGDDIVVAGNAIGERVPQGWTQVEGENGVQPRLDAGDLVDGARLSVFLQGELVGSEIADEAALGVVDIHIGGDAGELREIGLRKDGLQPTLGGCGQGSDGEEKSGEEEQGKETERSARFHVQVF